MDGGLDGGPREGWIGKGPRIGVISSTHRSGPGRTRLAPRRLSDDSKLSRPDDTCKSLPDRRDGPGGVGDSNDLPAEFLGKSQAGDFSAAGARRVQAIIQIERARRGRVAQIQSSDSEFQAP